MFAASTAQHSTAQHSTAQHSLCHLKDSIWAKNCFYSLLAGFPLALLFNSIAAQNRQLSGQSATIAVSFGMHCSQIPGSSCHRAQGCQTPMQSDGYMQSRQTVVLVLICHWLHVMLSSAGLSWPLTRSHKHTTPRLGF